MNIASTSEGPAFSHVLPIYNWFYPLAGQTVGRLCDQLSVFGLASPTRQTTRALYFHIPFCSSICSFCTFVKKMPQCRQEVASYVEALLREISLKSAFASVSGVPIRAIFWGGGTPSILDPEEIVRLGRAIQSHFDVSHLAEFSVEMSPMHLDVGKLQAMRSIGVTHARFGVQTFDSFYRRAFHLAATREQIAQAATILPRYFARVSFDMLYGMHGQDDDGFFADMEAAVGLRLQNIAFYPVNNAAVQPQLHKFLMEAGRRPTTGATKFYMNMILRRFLRFHGYLPHNGHEYVMAPLEEVQQNPVLTRSYTFVYHEHVYGYPNQELLGFGVNAVSRISRYVLNNTNSITQYVGNLLRDGKCIMTVKKHEETIDEGRGIILRLPYHGYVLKENIRWEAIPTLVLQALGEVLAAGFVRETEEAFELTTYGWQWYVNLMYYLSPASERHIIDRFIIRRTMDADRVMEDCVFADG
jgi:coproporphyrinogen III oxidase-like Fe-S oxidoreductase